MTCETNIIMLYTFSHFIHTYLDQITVSCLTVDWNLDNQMVLHFFIFFGDRIRNGFILINSIFIQLFCADGNE